MITINKLGMLVTAAFVAILMVGCSSDDGVDGTGGKPKQSINGTAAVGKAISNANLVIKVKDGSKKQGTTNNDGKFQIDITGLNGPFLMRVERANGGALFSIAAGGGTSNIHPFTDLIIRNWFKVQGLDIEAEFDGDLAAALLPTVEDINAIKQAIKDIIALTLVEFSLSAELDLITTGFDADGTGFDAYLDNVQVVIINNKITIVVKDPTTNIENPLVSDVAINNDFTLPDNTPPTMPGALRAVPASESDIIVVWDASTDNVGVVGYNVYRDGMLVDTTPFPVFSDVGLLLNTQYCYTVEAFDSANNTSIKADMTVCPQTLAAPDITPPPAPTSLSATSLGSSAISLIWVQSIIADVAGFDVYRGTSGNVNIKVATVTSTTYSDFSLNSDMQYCYKIVAFDAANNESAASTEACAITDVDITLPPPVSGGPGLSFSLSNYSVSEADATALITVKRGGDASLAVSVDYNVTDGSAIAEQDYTAVSGTLTWAANDSSDKTFLVPVKGDTVNDPLETIMLSLQNASTNTVLGAISRATITIADAVCSGELSQDITVDTTINQKCVVVKNDISIDGEQGGSARLLINPGVTLVFQNGTGFNVTSNGALTAIGTAEQPILLTHETQSPGAWKGVQFTFSSDTRNELDHVTIEYGGQGRNGSANLMLFGSSSMSRIKIRNSTLSHSSAYGFDANSNSKIDVFSNNVITQNESGPGMLPANLIGYLDSASRYTGNTVDVMTVSGSALNNELDTLPQVWPTLDVPYFVESSISVAKGLTLSPGTTVRFDAGAGFNVSRDGSLKAVGTAENNIVLTGDVQSPGYWRGIQYTFSNSINNQLDYVVVEYGGSGYNGNANVVAFGGDPQRISIKNSILRQSLGYGFIFSSSTIVDAFSNNIVTENGSINNTDIPLPGAGKLPATLVDKLDNTNMFTGNAVDVMVVGASTINAGAGLVWPLIDVPYLSGSLTITTGVVIEAGVTIGMLDDSLIRVNSDGTLVARGTAAEAIVFTSESDLLGNIVGPAAGGWAGIQFTNSNSNVLDYVTVEYGGIPGKLNGDGNIVLFGNGPGSTVTITNSQFNNSKSYGVWLTPEANAINLLGGTNVFLGNANGNVNP